MLAGVLEAVCRRDGEVWVRTAGACKRRYSSALRSGLGGLRCGRVTGYTFGRPDYLYNQLGPVVAADTTAARDIVMRCLSQLGGRAFAMEVPCSTRRRSTS